MMGVYMIFSYNTGNFYIGSSNNIEIRKKKHLLHLLNKKHCNTYLQNLYNKYGEDFLKFYIIEEVQDKNNLRKIEQTYIDILKPKININKYATGGDMISNHPDKDNIRKKQIEGTRRVSQSDEMRKIRSKNAKKLRPFGFMNGKNHSEKSKLKMRVSRGEKVIINNIVYNSYREAEEKTGMDRRTLSKDNKNLKQYKEVLF